MKRAFALFALCQAALWAESNKDIAQQIFEIMSHAPGVQADHRVVHAKGVVATGTFTPTAAAKELSRAAHFSGPAVPVTVRFSQGAADPAIPDNSPDANPRGMAIRFAPEGSRGTDIVAMSHNGFLVGTGEDFLALLQAQVATDRSKPHPWPIEQFLASHPAAMKFVTDPKPTPESFATLPFYSNNSFTFVNKDGAKQTGRYQILPVGGAKFFDEATAKTKSATYLTDELKTRLAQGPAKFRLVLQLPSAGDKTNDSTIVWADDRKTVELGEISITAVLPDSDAAEKKLAFDPTRLTDGITLSDDPIPAIRARVYALASVARHAH